MKPHDNMERFAKDASIRTSDAANERILNEMHEAYEESASSGRSARRLGYWDLVFENRVARFAAAAVIFLAAVTLIGELGRMLPGGGVAWAEVTQCFESVPFFNATIYMKEDATAEPWQMELWMSRDGWARVRVGTQVVFGRRGRVTDAFNVKSRMAVEPDERAVFFLRKLGETDEFSLDAVIRVMFGGEMQDVTPLVNPDAVISQDVVVFDVDLPSTPEWVRIWALRESRLPVRIRVWDPRDGEMTDAVFEYSREQAEEFFDPNAFHTLLQNGRADSRVNMAYAFLKDSGHRDITPEDIFEGSGYHVPEIQQVGITPDGAVWVIAAKGRNRMPNGYSFFGFRKIRDDLGRDYESLYCSHRTATDQSMEVFVPMDYPFDRRVPISLTLVCEVGDIHPHVKRELIGTVELTEWKQGQLWPEGSITDREWEFRIRMARKHADGERCEQAERILRTVEGEPADSAAALERERIRLRMLVQQGKLDEAVSLGEHLLPWLERDYRSFKGFGPNPSVFNDYILALGCTGRFDRAQETWQRVRGILADLPANLAKPVRQRMEETIQRDLDECLRVTVPRLSRKAHLTVEQLNDIFDIDIKKSELFTNYVFWDWNPEFEKPKYKNWERRLTELAEHYTGRPLPETMQLLKHNSKQEYAAHRLKMPGIDGYLVELYNRPLKNYACFYNFPESAGRLRMEGEIPDIELAHDLVYREGIDQQQRIRWLLGQFGLEVVEVNEPRSVWVARHDGGALKDPEQVRAPVPFDAAGKSKTGTMSSSTRGGFGFDYLFRNFMWWQNQDYHADGIIIVDETGITEPVSRDGPNWEGPDAPAMARQWFKDEMGVTFTEETRTMTTYVIRHNRERAK